MLLFLKKAQFYEKAAKRKPDKLIMITPYMKKKLSQSVKDFSQWIRPGWNDALRMEVEIAARRLKMKAL